MTPKPGNNNNKAPRKGQPGQKKKQNGGGQSLPAAVSSTSRNKGPKMSGARSGEFCVSNEELVSTLSMSATQVLADGRTSLAVNPGMTDSFPWLSAIGLNFQSYKFRKLRFIYRPACATTATGIVTLAFDPDPSNSTPATLNSLSALRHRVTGSPWSHLTLDIPQSAMAALGGRKMVRSSNEIVVQSSLPQFDSGTFYLYAGHGTAAIALVGTLYVSYTVEFFDPQPPEGGIGSCSFFSAADSSVGRPWGAAPESIGSEGILATTGTDVTFFRLTVPGYYFFEFYLEGTGLDVADYSLGFASASYDHIANLANSTTTWTGRGVLLANNDGAYVSLTRSSAVSTVTYAHAFFSRAPKEVLIEP